LNHGTRLPDLQCRISLAKRLLIPLPMIDEATFHVEHTPIHEPPAPTGALLNEFVHLWVNHLHG
jgi:hypothetical protein